MGKMFNKVNAAITPAQVAPEPPVNEHVSADEVAASIPFTAATLYSDGLVPGFVFYTGKSGKERPYLFGGERSKGGYPVLQCFDYGTLLADQEKDKFPGTSGMIRQATHDDVIAWLHDRNSAKRGGFKRRASGNTTQIAPPAPPVVPAPVVAVTAAPLPAPPVAPLTSAHDDTDDLYDQAVISLLTLGVRCGRFNEAQIGTALLTLGIPK